MNYTNLAIGIFALGFGLLTLILRITGKTGKLTKLEKMKESYGEKKGNLIHLFFYSIMPIILGIVLIVSAVILKQVNGNSGEEMNEISALYEEGKVEETQKRLLVYTKDHTTEYLAWTILGHTYYDQDNFDQAIESYTKATQADPKAFEPYSGLGIAYVKLEEFEKAKKAYEKALEISPNEGSVIGNLAGLYNSLGESKKAIEYGEKSTKLDPKDPNLFANLSIYYHKDGQLDKRDEMFNKAKELGYSDTDMQALTDTYVALSDTTSTEQ